jgi:hypothetical protein
LTTVAGSLTRLCRKAASSAKHHSLGVDMPHHQSWAAQLERQETHPTTARLGPVTTADRSPWLAAEFGAIDKFCVTFAGLVADIAATLIFA